MSGPNFSSEVQPKARLELSVNTEDGSLLTAPLSTVLLAATDGLHTDLYNIAHGELDVTTTTAQQGAADEVEDEDEAAPTVTQKKERLSNLSFAQRRHELAWRLVQHGKGLTHVSALTAAAASTDLSNATRVSTRALQHARTAWVQADEAQDALYFFHAQLFPARQSPHDVYGALDLQLIGKWLDMPTDLRLTVDRFHTSRESRWSAKEVAERWHMAVCDKLLRGEVAWSRRVEQQQQQSTSGGVRVRPPLWKVSLKGGLVQLTQGSPKQSGSQTIYPIEALLTVLSTATPKEWTLLSVEVRAQPKTGESNHQLEASLRQRYNLHRLCALAMAREEAHFRNSSNESTDASVTANDNIANTSGKIEATILSCPVARPLDRLFEVAHTFALSWQLEILSAQAQALKRGNWAAGNTKPIAVTPVRFFDQNQPGSNKNGFDHNILGIVSMSFWKVDDQYGHPAMGDLHVGNDVEQNLHDYDESADPKIIQQRQELLAPPVSNQLTLSIRAEATLGIRVSLSGAQGIMDAVENKEHIQSSIQEVLDAAANPFALSASGALLAATRLCSEQKCHAVVRALMQSATANPSDSSGRQSSVLPCWIHLTVERTSIAVAARISYYGVDDDSKGIDNQSSMAFLFRLTCDARTGSFVCTFSRSSSLLRMLACNDIKASESTALRILGLPQKRRRVAGTNAIGRVARDAFEGLVRSMNALGQRTGVGGAWKDRDTMSASLRQRAIQSASDDAKVSLVKCCGMAAMYGLSALALGVATGITVTHDMAGDALDRVDGVSLLPAPPLSVLLDHQLIETETQTTDGEKKKQSYIEQNLFAIGCTATTENLKLYPVDVTVHLDTPISVPRRVGCSLVKLRASQEPVMMNGGTEENPAKRQKVSDEDKKSVGPEIQDIHVEVERFAMLLSDVLE